MNSPATQRIDDYLESAQARGDQNALLAVMCASLHLQIRILFADIRRSGGRISLESAATVEKNMVKNLSHLIGEAAPALVKAPPSGKCPLQLAVDFLGQDLRDYLKGN
jgi:hypothetical protein